MLNNSENKAMENGYVVLPIEKYHELMKTIEDAEQAAENLIQIYVDYNKQISIKLDAEQIYAAAKKRYEASSFNTPERELIKPESFGAWTSTLTHEVTSKDEE